MPSIKIIALVASLATAAFAYTDSEIHARSDLDFTPEDLEILFGRDAYAEPEAEPENDLEALYHGLEILARSLDIDVEEMTYLAARDPGRLSSAIGKGKGFVSNHKDTIKSIGRHGLSAAGQASQIYQNHQQMQMMQGQQQQQEAWKRDLGVVEDDAEVWY